MCKVGTGHSAFADKHVLVGALCVSPALGE